MKAPLFRRLTWFKVGLLVVLLVAAGSLYTQAPALLIRACRGGERVKVVTRIVEKEVKPVILPQEKTSENQEFPTTPWRPEDSFSMPEIHLPDFPPALPERVETGNFEHLNTIANGINLKSSIHFSQGTTAARDRGKKGAYLLKVSLELLQPHAANGAELLTANPKLTDVLVGYQELMSTARVSPWFSSLYLHKQNQIRKNAATLTKLLDRHNFYDTDTILELRYPSTARKVLWMQADMDVVSDGSDGDRLPTMPEKILKSDYYQPMTSYRWKKQSSTPNPLLPRWQAKLAKLQKMKGDPAEVKYTSRVVNDLKKYSFLLAEYDPFIVVPLVFKEGRKEEYRPQLGDYVAIVVDNRVFPAIVGDFGPRYKTGEASLRLAKAVNPKATVYARPLSTLGASYIIFPGSREQESGPIDYQRLNTRVRELLDDIGGLTSQADFRPMKDLLDSSKSFSDPEKKKDNTESSNEH